MLYRYLDWPEKTPISTTFIGLPGNAIRLALAGTIRSMSHHSKDSADTGSSCGTKSACHCPETEMMAEKSKLEFKHKFYCT